MIAVHLARRPGEPDVPSVTTIWRILVRRGFVTPQPQKPPRSSYVRFSAEMPNDRWQADITHVAQVSALDERARRHGFGAHRCARITLDSARVAASTADSWRRP
jgi:hypothetical protein